MTARPLTLAASVVLLAIIGAGLGFVGLLLLAVASGVVPLLDSAGGLAGPAGLLGMAFGGAAVVVFVMAVGLWMGRGWAWLGSLAVAVAAVIGALIALETSGQQLPIQLGLVLTVSAVALLLAPSTRSASGIA